MAAIESLDGGLRTYGVAKWTRDMREVDAALAKLLARDEADDSDEGLLFRGVAFERRGDHEAAAKAYLKLVERNRNHVEGHLRLGHLAWKKRDVKSARDHGEQARLLSPRSDRPLVLLGRIEAADRIDAALILFDEALRTEPGS